MQPEQPNHQYQPTSTPPADRSTPLSTDFLDQIAPQMSTSKLTTNKPLLFGVIGLIAIIIVITLVVIAGSISASRVEPWQRLSLKLNATERLVKDSTPKLKSGSLRALNSTLTISLSNTQRDAAAPLARAGVVAKNIPAKVVTQESEAAALVRIEDARLNGVFDRTYAREMAYQLSTLLIVLKQLYASNPSEATKTFLMTTYNNLVPAQKAFAEYDSAKN